MTLKCYFFFTQHFKCLVLGRILLLELDGFSFSFISRLQQSGFHFLNQPSCIYLEPMYISMAFTHCCMLPIRHIIKSHKIPCKCTFYLICILGQWLYNWVIFWSWAMRWLSSYLWWFYSQCFSSIKLKGFSLSRLSSDWICN